MKQHSAIRYFKLIFQLLKIFGVATMTFDSNFRFIPSKLGITYNVLLMNLVFVCTYFGVKVSYFLDFTDRGLLEKITDTIQTLFAIGTALFILILHCIRHDRIIQIANDLRRSVDISITLCYQKTHQEKAQDVIKSVRFVILVNLSIAIICLLSTPTLDLAVFLYFVSMTICNFIINTLIMEYTIVLTVLTHLFDVLNTSLTENSDYETQYLGISFMQKYGLQMKLQKLSRCRDFFASLSRLSRNISKFMNAITLACIANIFLTLVIYGFYVTKPIIVGKHVIATQILIRCSAQLAFSVVSTVLLTRAAGSAVNQSKRTGEIVNECLHKEGFECHPDVAKQLNLFSNYLLHSNVQFGVYNLFTLDESLLISILGSITTYLVILLQFKQSQSILID